MAGSRGLSRSVLGFAFSCVGFGLSEALGGLCSSRLTSANLIISEERFFCPVFLIRVLASTLFGFS